MDQSIGSSVEANLSKAQFKPVTKSIVSEPSAKPKPLPKIQVEELEAPKARNTAVNEVVPQEPLAALGILSHFNIDTPTDEERKKLSAIWDYVSSDGASKNKALLKLVTLKNKLGQPRIGETVLDRVYRFVSLKQQEMLLQQELKGV